MTRPATVAHVVRRQVLEVDVRGSEVDGLALQRRLPDLCTSLVAPAIERALDRCAPDDGWVVVERLDVDVGRLPLDDLERDLPEAVGRAVESYLRQHAPASRSSSPSSGTTAAGVMRRRTDRETADDALVSFLRIGRLPWSFRVPPGRHLEEVLLTSWTETDRPAEPPGPARRTALLDVLTLPAARRRLRTQFSPTFRTVLLRLLDPAAATTAEGVLACLGQVDRSTPAGELFVAAVEEAVLAAVADRSPVAPAELLAAAWRAVPPDAAGRPAVRAAVARRRPGAVGGTAPVGTSPAASAQPADVAQDQPHAAPGRPPASRSGADEPGSAEGAEDGIYVDDAGLVLLHPFLPRCFEALGIAVGEDLLLPERALCLLHHLATGAGTAPEYELVLPKVLCGLAIDEPAPLVTLTDAEVEEARALLKAAIGHWGALRGSGADALRATFLQRPGMLSPDEDGGWLLRVEEQSFDILLDQLPWGISMVRLPWMRRLLRVEWR
jgi:hypothetical protein